MLRAYIGATVKRALHGEEMRLHLDAWLDDEAQKAFRRQIAQMDGKYSEEVRSIAL
ncbi:hypothetical protein ACIPSK_06765 [Rhizobium sp. LARHSG275]|uniref:hypothetical protein n=1 Tax=unclassified Rhizobium TaxID=2613769 RepID=UPI0021A92426|nr:hypothetical protein [Rhizobium leguminosarum]UWM80912.1 hypothetical protein N2A41_19885 [Rhizobium leguminosarum bv. viciae]